MSVVYPNTPNGFGQPKCICGQVKFPKCLFSRPTGWGTSWKTNFENYSTYITLYKLLYIFFDKMVSILINIISLSNTSSRFRHMFLLRWLIYALHTFLCNNMLHVFRSNHHCSWKFHKFYRKTAVLESLFKKVADHCFSLKMMKLYKDICSALLPKNASHRLML